MIKMLTAVSGANFSIAAGEQTGIFSADEEKRYIKAGLAEAVKKQTKKKAKKAK